MGCDIHAEIQYKPKDYSGHVMGDWYVWCWYDHLWRDYQLFRALVNGHSRGPEGLTGVADERGLPTDHVRSWRKEVGVHNTADHTFSWLTPAEYAKAIKNYVEYSRSSPNGTYLVVRDTLLALEREGFECRFVFGFDN